MADILLYSFVFFLLGLVIGSFLNCVIYRLEHKKSFLKGRSYCPHCKKELRWVELIPVLSFIFLKGRCAHCKKNISIQYPLVEITTGLVFMLLLYAKGGELTQVAFMSNGQILLLMLDLVFWMYVASALVVIFVYDLKHFLIPDKVLFPAIAITGVYQLVFHFPFFGMNALWAAVSAFAFFTGIFLLSRGKWMGFGDCKLVVLLGLILGFPGILVGLFLAFLFGAVIGLTLMFPGIAKDGKGLRREIPFAPFLIAGTLATMAWGPHILNWYINFLIW